MDTDSPPDVSTVDDLLPTTSPSSSAYLSHLTALPLPELLAEPAALSTHAHHLTASLTSLAHSALPTLLALHATSAALSNSLDSLASSAAALSTDALPALDDAATRFRGRTETALSERARARRVVEIQDKIGDLLDVPVIIETCVRNGYYSEALALAKHVSDTIQAHSNSKTDPNINPTTNNPTTNTSHNSNLILQAIHLDTAHALRGMLATLLRTLRDPATRKLPALWKAASFLRRMQVLDEEQLALAFLTGRAECLKEALAALEVGVGVTTGASGKGDESGSGEDTARYLRRYVDVWREGMHDIITQYSAIFLDPRPALSTTSSDPPPLPPPAELTASLRTLLTTYASHALSTHLLPTLRAYLLPPSTSALSTNSQRSSPQLLLPPSLLPSLLTQLTYCASALARTGFDFRSLLVDIVQHAVLAGVGAQIRAGGEVWCARVAEHMSGKLASKPSEWLVLPELASQPPFPDKLPPSAPVHTPPHILGSFPPLAELTNALLNALNGLRLLVPAVDALVWVGSGMSKSGIDGRAKVNGDKASVTETQLEHERGKRAMTSTSYTLMVLLLQEVEDTLCKCGETYIKYARGWGVSGRPEGEQTEEGGSKQNEETPKERRVLRALGTVYFSVLVPYVRRALVEGVYGLAVTGTSEGDKLSRLVDQWEQSDSAITPS